MSGMGSHQSHDMMKDEWLTPPEILQPLGKFDLDPCAPIESMRPWSMADNHYTLEDGNGLEKEWFGRVWCNPPYGRETGIWLNKLAAHGNGIALIFARTETKMFVSEVWEKAHSLLFIHNRLFFHHVDGTRAKSNSGAPSVLIAYGEDNSRILKDAVGSNNITGSYVSGWTNSP